MTWRRALKPAAILFLCSYLAILAGIALGRADWMPKGEGQDLRSGIHRDLFRFDAEYYYSIATSGYSYNGDPYSSPNIVFAPLFPLLVDTLAHLGIEEVAAGFLLNKIFLFLSALMLFLFLSKLNPSFHPFWILLAMMTSAGSYSFHSYYSESSMLFFLSAALLGWQRKSWVTVAISSALLGATRITALPIVTLFATFFLKMAWDHRRDRSKAGLYLIYALLCPIGLLFYLGYIARHFGNPLILFPQIQNASWGFFHPPIDWWGLLTGWRLMQHLGTAAGKGFVSVTDPQTLNLLWTLLALMSVVYVIKKFRRELFTWIFVVYFLFIYFTNSTSEYLISAHRFFALMLPIFLMFNGLHHRIAKFSPWVARAVTGLLLLLNLAYGLFHTAYFNNGVWYYF